jgi:hypothetical protein
MDARATTHKCPRTSAENEFDFAEGLSVAFDEHG